MFRQNAVQIHTVDLPNNPCLRFVNGDITFSIDSVAEKVFSVDDRFPQLELVTESNADIPTD